MVFSCARREQEQNSAQIVEAINQVDAHSHPEDDWQTAAVGMDIYGGGQVRTGTDSSARLELMEGVVRLWEKTLFTVKEYTTRQERSLTRLFLQEGRLWAHLTATQPHEFSVETASAVAAVRDTRFSVQVGSDQTTLVSVAQGEVVVTAQGQSVTVTVGLQAIVKPGQPPEPPEPMSADEIALWTTEGDTPDLVALVPTVPVSEPTPTSTPTPTSVPTPTSTPTPTPGPTSTSTPLPTPTHVPTPTSTPTLRGKRWAGALCHVPSAAGLSICIDGGLLSLGARRPGRLARVCGLAARRFCARCFLYHCTRLRGWMRDSLGSFGLAA
jgi:hypothetical protein